MEIRELRSKLKFMNRPKKNEFSRSKFLKIACDLIWKLSQDGERACANTVHGELLKSLIIEVPDLKKCTRSIDFKYDTCAFLWLEVLIDNFN